MSATVLMTLARPDGAGCHRMAVQLAGAFRRRGHRVVLLCGPGRKGDVDPLLHGDAAPPEATGVTVHRRDGFLRPFDPGLVRELDRLVDREAVDCLIGFQQADIKYAALAGWRAGVPCVIHGANRHTFWGPWPLPPLKGWVYGHLVRRGADLIVCTSDTVRTEFVHRFGVAAERTRIQPNGIDVRGFPRPDRKAAAGARRELGLAPDDVVLINVGRLAVQKGQDLLLRAFAPIAAAHPEVKLVLVGAVPGSGNRSMERFETELRKQVDTRDLESQVVFTGWRDDIPLLLRAADAYVHAARWEGPALCLSVLEAMAAELPVISTDCSGHPAGFENGRHGFIVPAGAADPLRDAMDRLVSATRADRRAMGSRARELALKRYDSQESSARFVGHVESVVSRAGT